MKKHILLTALATAAVIISCSKSSDDSSPKSMDFVATASPFTSGPTLTWTTSDQIGLFANETLYELTAKTAGPSVTFNGTLPKASLYNAISPYSSKSTTDGTSISATVPEQQSAVKDGVSASAVIAVASSSNTTLAFKNATALLKFSLASDNNIKEVSIASKGSENLAGDIAVNPANEKITVVKGVTAVTMTAGTSNIAKGTYYVSVIPATYVDGLNITLTDEYGRVSTVTSEEFITSKASQALDLGQIDKNVVFVTPVLTTSPADISVAGDGETAKTTLSAAFNKTTAVKAPDWATVSVNGAEVSATVGASPLSDDVRYGKIHIEGTTDNGPATADIYIAQAAKGAKLMFDSFSGTTLDSNWKGNISRANARLENGCLKMVGTGEYNNPSNTYPLFRMDTQVRQKYNDSGSTNQFICTIDIKADGGCGGIQAFNAFGYTEKGTYDFTSKQNYIIYISATEGADGGGYYCMNSTSANAMDNWAKPQNTSVTTWLRLEVSNVDRAGDGVAGDWALKAVWSLEEDKDGVLQKKDLLFHGAMWWWNDSF